MAGSAIHVLSVLVSMCAAALVSAVMSASSAPRSVARQWKPISFAIVELAADKPAIGDVPNYHLGIARTDRTKKLAFNTVQMLARVFNAGKIAVIDESLRADDDACGNTDLHRHLFARPDGDRVLALWTKTQGCSISLHTGEFIRSAVEYLADGRAVPVADLGGDELRHVTLVAGAPRIFLLRH